MANNEENRLRFKRMGSDMRFHELQQPSLTAVESAQDALQMAASIICWF
jgi:hypothetical protein